MIQLYLLDTELLVEEQTFREIMAQMPADRQQKILAYRFWKDRRLSLGAGVVLDAGLRAQGQSLETCRIAYGGHGKPYLADRKDLWFSLSHSGEKVICAFSRETVGCDMEALSRPYGGLIRRICTDREYACVKDMVPAAQREAFFRLWTAKESYGKMTGAGLSMPPQALELNLTDPISAAAGGSCLSCKFAEYSMDGYRITLCSQQDSFPPNLPVPITKQQLEQLYPSIFRRDKSSERNRKAGNGKEWQERSVKG